jgi:hypothetical protein
MKRYLTILLTIIISILLLLIVGGETWTYFKPKETATIFFKPGVVDGNKAVGEVTKKDKYVVIKPENGPEAIYTWEQIQSITGTTPVLTQGIERFTERIDFVSKLGILAAAGVFLIGMIQYEQGQQWKSEEFLASKLNEFSDSPKAQRTRDMLDMVRLYPDGRKIALFPDREREVEKSPVVTREEVYDALSLDKATYTDKEKVIRASFDGFFDYLETFDHYIDLSLVRKESVYVYINYWIEMLLGHDEMIDEEFRKRALTYAAYFKFVRVEKFLLKYKPPSFDPVVGIKLEPTLF